VLHLFEKEHVDDSPPRDAIAVGRAWIRGEVPMRDADRAAFAANATARDLPEPARFAALAAGQGSLSLMWRHTIWAQRPMRLGRLARPFQSIGKQPPDGVSVTGNANSCQRSFVSWS
jgi:hypothetical protein